MKYSAFTISNGQNVIGASEPEAAGDVALHLAIGGVEISAARDRAAVPKRRLAEFRVRLHEQKRRRRRQIVRRYLIEQVGGEIRELVFDLQLNPRREEGSALGAGRKS